MGLNLSNQQIARELDLTTGDVQAMTESLRAARMPARPAEVLESVVECDEVYVTAGHKGQPAMVAKKVAQAGVALGSLITTDEYVIYNRLPQWGFGHKAVHHGRGEYARVADGDGFCEVHVNTLEVRRCGAD